MLYLFFALCAAAIALLSRSSGHAHAPTNEAPIPHVVMPDSLATSPLGVALNPAVEEEVIQATMMNDEPEAEAETSTEEEETPTEPKP